MNTIEITKGNALKAFKSADSKGKELLKNLLGSEILSEKITDRIKTMDDVYQEEGIDKEAFRKSFMFIEDFYAAEYRLAIKVLNEGWEPNWSNSSEYKYVPYVEISGVGFSRSGYGYWYSYSGVGSRLCFKSKETCLFFLEQFKTQCENYFIIK